MKYHFFNLGKPVKKCITAILLISAKRCQIPCDIKTAKNKRASYGFTMVNPKNPVFDLLGLALKPLTELCGPYSILFRISCKDPSMSLRSNGFKNNKGWCLKWDLLIKRIYKFL